MSRWLLPLLVAGAVIVCARADDFQPGRDPLRVGVGGSGVVLAFALCGLWLLRRGPQPPIRFLG